jgi:hypothetical protein
MAASALEALQRSHAIYRRARELGSVSAASMEPEQPAATPDRLHAAHGALPAASPRLQAERELARNIRQLRAVQNGTASFDDLPHTPLLSPATPGPLFRSPDTDRRKARSVLEAQLLDALGSAEAFGQEREELLASLRAADMGAAAAQAEAERLRHETATLQAALEEQEEERRRSESTTLELEEAAKRLADELVRERESKHALQLALAERRSAPPLPPLLSRPCSRAQKLPI